MLILCSATVIFPSEPWNISKAYFNNDFIASESLICFAKEVQASAASILAKSSFECKFAVIILEIIKEVLRRTTKEVND